MLEFLPVLAVLVVVPGPNNLVVLRSLRRGRAAGAAAAVGASLGLLVWTLATAGGVGAVLDRVPGLRVAGAVTVIAMGLWSLRPRDPAAPPGVTGFRGGLAVCLGNPRALLTAAAVLPQYAAGPVAVLALGGVWALAAAVWNLALVAGARRTASGGRVERFGGLAVVAVGVFGLAQAV